MGDVSENAIASLLDSSPRPVVVTVSTTWCAPCQLLKPVMEKLAFEFADQAEFASLDGDEATEFATAHSIDGFPEVLLFRNKALVDRVAGFTDPGALRGVIAGFVGTHSAPSKREADYLSAYGRAVEDMTRLRAPAEAEAGKHMSAVEPLLDAFQEKLGQRVASGELAQPDANRLMMAEYARLTTPFQDVLKARNAAHDASLTLYKGLMTTALAQFMIGAGGGTADAQGGKDAAEIQQTVGSQCKLGAGPGQCT